ncbi:MCE family protein, partial [Pseudonocardia bannensis]|nr:MCE family protein [Pseudonocardia bannensis]
MSRPVLTVVLLSLVSLLASGCGVLSGGLRGVDLPGGADLGDDPYEVTVEFSDVVDLVPQSLVKVNDVPVGSVTTIAVDPHSWVAEHGVRVTILDDPRCVNLMEEFIAARPELWNEDIGV